MGSILEDKEREKWKRKTSEHANDQLGWSPVFSMDKGCKGKHLLLAGQEA